MIVGSDRSGNGDQSATAAGLIAFGLYGIAEAAYRRIARPRAWHENPGVGAGWQRARFS
jgi:hypothetical protein